MTALDQPLRSAEPADGVLRELTVADFEDLRPLLEADEDAYCVVIERICHGRLEPTMSGGQTLGWFEGDALKSAIFVGANLTVMSATPAAIDAYVGYLSRRSRTSSAIVGYRDDVIAIWNELEPAWGPCREIRDDQHFMVMTSDPEIAINPDVRPARLAEHAAIMPPSIDMFTEEVGVSPVAGGRGPGFRARVASSILEGRTYLLMDDERVIFKAEVGAVGGDSAQLQGVWVAPDLRGEGIAAPALAAVVKAVRRDHAPNVNLYVNGHNSAAIATYRRTGFRQVGTFATVLF